jgi:hypothetical protein
VAGVALAFAAGVVVVVGLPTGAVVVVVEAVVVVVVVAVEAVAVEAVVVVEVAVADAAPVDTTAAGTAMATAVKAIKATRWSEGKRIRSEGTPPRGRQDRVTVAR